jgi:hypothetical protein
VHRAHTFVSSFPPCKRYALKLTYLLTVSTMSLKRIHSLRNSPSLSSFCGSRISAPCKILRLPLSTVSPVSPQRSLNTCAMTRTTHLRNRFQNAGAWHTMAILVLPLQLSVPFILSCEQIGELKPMQKLRRLSTMRMKRSRIFIRPVYFDKRK